MKNRKLILTTAILGAGLIGGAVIVGCIGTSEDTTEAMSAELVACGLDDGTVERGAHLHACDPQNTKKTTICHVPPGNPANAHTLCIGNAAVPAHLRNHDGDSLGPCAVETPCPPATGAAGTGGGDSTGAAGTGSETGAAGSGAAGTTGAAGTGDPVVVP